MPLNNFSGKTVFISGATRGIGQAIAIALKLRGAKVVGSGTSIDQPLEYLDEYIQADFSDINQIRSCADRLKFVKPDILINNAGINVISPFCEIIPQDFLRIHQVNVFAPFSLCQAVIPGMRERGWGRIVNISSIWGKISKEFRACYSASKFALDGMTLALAAECSAENILANCIAPGFTDTELTRGILDANQIRKLELDIPLKRMANVDEIASFVVWLASPENTYITGQNIAVDGGFSRA
jgi:3-oxoacyl-[acyl-carrier protein] reductase